MTTQSIELTAAESGNAIPLDAGVYPATVTGIEAADAGRFGDQVKLLCETDELDDGGEPIVLWAWCSRKLTSKSKLFRYASNITGTAPEFGRAYRIEEMLVGKRCRVQLSEAVDEGGETRVRVTDILPASKRQSPAPTATPEPDGEPDHCGECVVEASYYGKDGTPYCNAHGPRGAEVPFE